MGSYPTLSGAMARKKAAELREEAATGADITETGRARKQAFLILPYVI
ncbi:hypothetical protein [Zhongshania sp.]